MSFQSETESIILCLCEDANSPRSLAIYMMVQSGEWAQLVNLKVEPRNYSTAEAYFLDATVTDLLRKCAGLPTGTDLKAAAIEAFWKSEAQCYRTNERLAKYLVPGYQSFQDSEKHVGDILSLARKYVSFVLGPCPIPQDGKFGPGATYGDKGQLTTVPDKMSSTPTLTTGASSVLPFWGKTAWARALKPSQRSLVAVRGNRFTTVPKDSSKDRGICIEPSINIYYQLAMGFLIRSRLRRVNIDLQRAQDIHRLTACEASIRGHLCTIDLSNASDTICKNLVKLLLPSSWYNALNQLRSPTTTMPTGEVVVLEKFSSMGNGYTFELETLIFLSLSWAAMVLNGTIPLEGRDTMVFGDDIIVPTSQFRCVSAVLSFFGFSINTRKTYADGKFRESCGGDFFDGKAVRPFFLKELPHEPQQWIVWANGLRRSVGDHYGPDYGLGRFAKTWFKILDRLPSQIRRLRGPQALGDICIHDSYDRWSVKIEHSIRYVRCWTPAHYRRVEWKHFRPEVVLATALKGIGDGALGVTPRDAVLGFHERWVPYS